VQQEHLIHKDLINSKLEKLWKHSEEKRRGTNILLNRHLSGLSFFIENAQKQMTILNQAHSDLLKNKEIVDYYGDMNSANANAESNNTEKEEQSFSNNKNNSFLNSIASSFSAHQQSQSKSKSKQLNDDELIDECLLEDLT
jgi:hypothetical protein